MKFPVGTLVRKGETELFISGFLDDNTYTLHVPRSGIVMASAKINDPDLKIIGFGDHRVGDLVKIKGDKDYHGREGILTEIGPEYCKVKSEREEISIRRTMIVQSFVELPPMPTIDTAFDVINLILTEFLQHKSLYIVNLGSSWVPMEKDAFRLEYADSKYGQDRYIRNSKEGINETFFQNAYPSSEYYKGNLRPDSKDYGGNFWLACWKKWMEDTHPEIKLWNSISDKSTFPDLVQALIQGIELGHKKGSVILFPSLKRFLKK